MEMGTAAFALSIGTVILLTVCGYSFALYQVKQYAKRTRESYRNHAHCMQEIIADNECRPRLEEEQARFLKRFEWDANYRIKNLYSSARQTSMTMVIALMIGPTCGYFFNRSEWSFPNLIVSLSAGIAYLAWGIYSHLKYSQFKKLSE